MKVTEATIQSLLMCWVMNSKNHALVIPNVNSESLFMYGWESDLVSVTHAGLFHEYEVKLTRADYNRDAIKRKHLFLGDATSTPSYFWYVTFEFRIDPPEKAGWIYIRRRNDIDDPGAQRSEFFGYSLVVEKEAPRLNNWHINEKKQEKIALLLSWKLTNLYKRDFLMGRAEPEAGATVEFAV